LINEIEEKGKLTVFLGAAKGVGKTYSMLEAAKEKLSEGVDLVAGWIEPSEYPETRKLWEGIPVIAPKETLLVSLFLQFHLSIPFGDTHLFSFASNVNPPKKIELRFFTIETSTVKHHSLTNLNLNTMMRFLHVKIV
jgi:hypothetical protein